MELEGKTPSAIYSNVMDKMKLIHMCSVYNIEDASSPGRLELEVRGLYTISPRIDAQVQTRYYFTGADDPGAVRSSEFDILCGLIYHLERTQ